MQKAKKTMSAFTALNETQQKAIVGGQGTTADDGGARIIDAIVNWGRTILGGVSSAGSAAGSIGAGATKP